MKSPFAIFRKHARVLTVILTGLAMFAFIIMGQLKPEHFPVVMGVLLGAGLFWWIGARTGKPTELATAGALLGGAIGLFGPSLGGPGPAVETSVGNISRRELNELLRRRQTANRFLQLAFTRSAKPEELRFRRPPQFSLFGGTPSEDVVQGFLLRNRAERMGIVVSDDAVTEFIKQATGNKLSVKDFIAIRTEMRLSETGLYNVLRDELKARMALELSAPRHLPTPEQYWKIYRKLNVRQELEVTAVPVKDFAADVEEPSESELASFFEQYKADVANLKGPGEPGFFQPRRVRLAYLEADYETIESQVPEVSDTDVEIYYNQNKQTLYRNKPIPDDEKKDGEKKEDEQKPLDPEFTPEKKTAPAKKKPEPKPTEKKLNEKKSSEDKPADKSDDDVKADPQPGDDGGPEDQPDKQESPQKKDQPTEKNLPTKKPVEAKKPNLAKPDEKNSMQEKKPDGETTSKRKNEDKPLPEFKPLDEILRGEIRDRLLEERTLAAIADKIDKAAAYMYDLGLEYNSPLDENAKKITPQEIDDRLKSYAKKSGLRYVSTEPLTETELAGSEQYAIGGATEPVENQFEQPNVRTVVEQLFGTQSEQLYAHYKAEDPLTKNRYAYWKIEDVEPHVPNLDDPGVRQQVVEAWKQHQARPMAESRAEHLADMVRNSDKSMSDSLAEQTVTGEKGDLQLTVLATEAFSWLRTLSAPQTSPFQRPPPQLSTISAIDKAGPKFMEIVFDRLKNDEVGVAPNADRSIYYVVKVKNRVPSTPAAEEALRQSFLREGLFFSAMPFGQSPYQHEMTREQQKMFLKWSQQFVQQYAVRFDESARRRQ